MNVLVDSIQLERFRALIVQHLGLRFEDGKRAWLGDVLHRRCSAETLVDASPLGQYHRREHYLARLDTPRHGAELRAELAALAQELTVCETYFFRNHEQFQALLECVVPARLAAAGAGTPLRVLSAGCASGEEAYSIVMTLRRVLPPERPLVIHAVDVNPAALLKARSGRYTEWSLRETPPDMRERWFRPRGTELELDESIRAAVTFEQRNLADAGDGTWLPSSFDVVFCRNVLMYFAPHVALAVVRRLARWLAPGGYLFLGHAETLRGISQDFDLRHTHATFYYQRRSTLAAAWDAGPWQPHGGADLPADAPAAASGQASTAWFESIAQASERVRVLTEPPGLPAATPDAAEAWQFGQPLDQWGLEPPADAPMEADSTQMGLLFEGSQLGSLPERWDFGLDPVSSQLDHAIDLFRHERFADALRLVEALPADATDPQVPLLHAMLLVHTGRFAAAEEACARLLALDNLNPAAHYVLALCREGEGDAAGAADRDQVAAYLDPAFAMPRLHLGLLARRQGNRSAMLRELSQALTLLNSEDASRVLLFGGGFTREALVALCRSELQAGEARG